MEGDITGRLLLLSTMDGTKNVSMDEVLSRLRYVEAANHLNGCGGVVPPPLANPSPLGLLGFAIVSFLSGTLKMVSDREARADGLLAGTAIWIGGVAQIIAGVVQFPKNNSHSATVFCLFGMHWISIGYINTLRRDELFPTEYHESSEFVYYALLTVTTVILWIPTFRMNKVLSVTLLVVICAFTLDALAAFGSRAVEIIAGAFSCLAAVFAFYMALLDLVNEAWRMHVLPLFPHRDHRQDYDQQRSYVPKMQHHKDAVAWVHQ